MESIILLAAEVLFDPFVIVPALAVAAALISGLAARLVDVWDRVSSVGRPALPQPPRRSPRHHRLVGTGTGPIDA